MISTFLGKYWARLVSTTCSYVKELACNSLNKSGWWTTLMQVVNDTCIEIRSATPHTVCLGSNTTKITLRGRGFTNQLVNGQATCRFKADKGLFYSKSTSHSDSLHVCAWTCMLVIYQHFYYTATQPTETVLYDTIVCPFPTNFNSTGLVHGKLMILHGAVIHCCSLYIM